MYPKLYAIATIVIRCYSESNVLFLFLPQQHILLAMKRPTSHLRHYSLFSIHHPAKQKIEMSFRSSPFQINQHSCVTSNLSRTDSVKILVSLHLYTVLPKLKTDG